MKDLLIYVFLELKIGALSSPSLFMTPLTPNYEDKEILSNRGFISSENCSLYRTNFISLQSFQFDLFKE